MEPHNNDLQGMWSMNHQDQGNHRSLLGGATKVNVMVTGGAGYIGTHTLVQLLSQDFVSSVIVVDNLLLPDGQSGKPECLKRVEQLTGRSLTFYNVDVTQVGPLEAIFRQVLAQRYGDGTSTFIASHTGSIASTASSIWPL